MIIMMIFNLSTSYFHEKIVSLFWELLNDEPDLVHKCVCVCVYGCMYYEYPTQVDEGSYSYSLRESMVT
jgi:hypothetical protein